MPYQYSFDRTTLGNAWWYKNTYVFYQKGLKRLRTLLDAWKEKAGTDSHPYEREVRDLTTMIEWGDDRLKQIDDSGEIHISGISRGSLRYLKAAVTLQVIEKEKEIAVREQEGFPGGVLDAMRRDLQEMKRKDELLKIEPADCLWEVLAKPIAPAASPSAAAPSPQPIHLVKRNGRTRRKWDFFISHAAEEADFARSLAFKLEEYGFQVWYDAFVLTAGDSLLEKIDEGLARSRYGVVILSHAFFKKSWTKKELDGLAALEGKKKGQKVILPVWHDLTVKEVRKYSPSLAGRVGVPTKDGLERAPSSGEDTQRVIGWEPSKGRANLIATLQFANYGCTLMVRKPRANFARVHYNLMCPGNQGAIDLQRAGERVTPRSSFSD